MYVCVGLFIFDTEYILNRFYSLFLVFNILNIDLNPLF